MALKVIFRSQIDLKQIELNYLKSVDKKSAEDWAYTMGKAPFIYIANPEIDGGGIMIDTRDIIKLKIYNNKFFPYIDMIIKDPTNLLSDKLHPLDNSTISFYKRSESENLMPIRVDFVVSNFRIIKDVSGESTDKTYYVRANLNMGINVTTNKSYKGTSFNVLKGLASDLKLGFASNMENTDDYMTWINPGNYLSEFIQEIINYSYKNDNSFLYSFIDLYYNLTYIDIESQLSERTEDQKSVWNESLVVDGEEIVTPLLLSNHPNMRTTNMYIDKWNLENSSRDINTTIGYDAQVYFYDRTTNDANYHLLNTISNPRRDGTKIDVRTRIPDENTRNYSMGKQDRDNVHKNFLFAKKQNENNIEFVDKIKMSVIINNPNFSLYRFQNIELVLYELNSAYELEIDKKTDSYKINERLSGEWLITGINYIYEYGNFVQELILVKRELTLKYNKEKLDQITRKFYEINQQNV